MLYPKFFSILIFSSLLHASSSSLPNIIFVLADDLGMGDIFPTNPDCRIKTPHLQKMAEEGITFFDAHTSSSVCTPTRYGLLTGRYNWRSRLARGVLNGTSTHLIPENRATVAKLLKNSGYHTNMIGKWHLGWDWAKADPEEGKWKNIDFTKPVKNGPDINGFDKYYGFCGSLDMPPYVWVDTGRVTALPNREEGISKGQDPYGWYRKGPIGSDFSIDDTLSHLFDKSIDYIKDRAKKRSPFFLYFPLPAPHTPIVPVPPYKDESQMNPYADFVMQIDSYMGKLMNSLIQAGIDENTLVFFTSDNGCSPLANFDLLKKFGHDPSAGFRGHKADIYEGGHRVPMIVRWPKVIKSGQKTSALSCLTDFYDTMREITGQPKIDNGGEDSFSLLSIFRGETDNTRETLISHSIAGLFSIRQGNWKLCLSRGSGGWSNPKEKEAIRKNLPSIQLFNLKEDKKEEKNLQGKMPAKVKELMLLLDKEVKNGRSTQGNPVLNDREVTFLPKNFSSTKSK